MAFKRKQDLGSGDQYKFDRIGQKLRGYYLGSFPHEGNYGPTKKHLFKTEKGVVAVFGQTHLSMLLEGEKPGLLMEITYEKDKKSKMGNPMKCYLLDIDADKYLDADQIPDSVEDVEEPSGYDTGDEPEAEDNEEPLDEVKTAPARSIAPRTATASSRARVDAILAKRGKAS